MRLEEFSYSLPKELIAQYPLENRSQARLLVLNRKTSKITHLHFHELIRFFKKDDCLVLNNTKVFKARLRGRKLTGGKLEVLLVRERGDNIWEALLSSSKGINIDSKIHFGDTFYALIIARVGGRWHIKFKQDVHEIIRRFGNVPLPHYIKRLPVFGDEENYQTVYAEKRGSIAAPTAGLHFTKALLQEIKKCGVEIAEITLHIGPGTFKPIRTKNIEDHVMDEEYFEISQSTADAINRAKRVWGVGTSVCRALETFGKSPITEFAGPTKLFIHPEYRFNKIDCLITNFHLPCSTPLVLVCAFAGFQRLFRAYQEAIEKSYRFLSYGDAMLIM